MLHTGPLKTSTDRKRWNREEVRVLYHTNGKNGIVLPICVARPHLGKQERVKGWAKFKNQYILFHDIPESVCAANVTELSLSHRFPLSHVDTSALYHCVSFPLTLPPVTSTALYFSHICSFTVADVAKTNLVISFFHLQLVYFEVLVVNTRVLRDEEASTGKLSC